MLHLNLAIKMFQCCTFSTVKSFFESVTHCNKVHVNFIRLFYNDRNSISYLQQYLRKRQGLIELNAEEGRRKSKAKASSPSPLDSLLFDPVAPEMHNFLTFNWKHWWEHTKVEYMKAIQKYRYEKYEVLGPDLATAKFVLKCGGRVKFANHEWIDNINQNEICKIPNEYKPDFVLEGLDLRGYPLEYENLYIICNLHYIKWLSLRGCSVINDWSLDKLSTEYPTLEYLDISECMNVSERGLEALYRMPNLKQLIVTDFHGSAAFELTCVMLEDVNPYLKCQILKPEREMLLIRGHEK